MRQPAGQEFPHLALVALDLGGALQPHRDRAEQVVRQVRLGDVVVGAEGHAGPEVAGIGLGGYDDKRQPFVVGMTPHPLQELKAVAPGHADVAHNQVRSHP